MKQKSSKNKQTLVSSKYHTIRYDTIAEFNVDSTAEYSA